MGYNYTDSIESEYNFGDEINNSDFKNALNSLAVISYRYIDFDKTKYHFFQDCFDNKDILEYFDFMNFLTSYPFNDILSNKDKDWHLYNNNYFKDLRFKELVDTALGIKKGLRVEQVPSFYHFALYTNETASRHTNIKSPRVYFFIGENAIIYPLFYDPYHEINP